MSYGGYSVSVVSVYGPCAQALIDRLPRSLGGRAFNTLVRLCDARERGDAIAPIFAGKVFKPTPFSIRKNVTWQQLAGFRGCGRIATNAICKWAGIPVPRAHRVRICRGCGRPMP